MASGVFLGAKRGLCMSNHSFEGSFFTRMACNGGSGISRIAQALSFCNKISDLAGAKSSSCDFQA